jgi:hypothetical protein
VKLAEGGRDKGKHLKGKVAELTKEDNLDPTERTHHQAQSQMHLAFIYITFAYTKFKINSK